MANEVTDADKEKDDIEEETDETLKGLFSLESIAL